MQPCNFGRIYSLKTYVHVGSVLLAYRPQLLPRSVTRSQAIATTQPTSPTHEQGLEDGALGWW
ncbi:hypothetical protein BDA96_10G284300 [Sorghum bicolor]|uniref:Uncharacterized protein n=1 Tax=Sorghum bicolor TaxID=4558 RepID=A0A921U1U8_SORBI|nr:hypothetical protein BDA96_10G284300 [Sorghum bicolor]